MVPFWKKKLGGRLRTVGEKFIGGTGLEQLKMALKLPVLK
jgi:hypothetical protein